MPFTVSLRCVKLNFKKKTKNYFFSLILKTTTKKPVEFKLNITNCAKVRIFSEAFANTIFHGHFENIHDFQLLERAFSKSTAKITVNNSRMDELQRLEASLKEIKFSNTHIGTILTNAFDVIKIDSIIFENCHIDTIQSNAFTEKVRKSF